MTYFTEKPLYVLLVEPTPAVLRRIEKSEGGARLIETLSRNLSMPGEAFVVPATKDNSWLTAIARHHPQSRCYDAGVTA